MSNPSFLCGSCLSVICSDCKEIAEEYPELLQIKNREISALEHKIEELSSKLASAERLRDGYERVAKLGMPEILLGWIDSQARKSPEGEGSETRLRKAIDKALRDLGSFKSAGDWHYVRQAILILSEALKDPKGEKSSP